MHRFQLGSVQARMSNTMLSLVTFPLSRRLRGLACAAGQSPSRKDRCAVLSIEFLGTDMES